MKTCAKCKIEKEDNDFTLSQLKKKSGWCKDCVSIYNKKWAQANPEKKKANDKKWAQNNPEKIAVKNKKWKQENSDYHKQWAQTNSEKTSTSHKKWKQANREKINAQRRWRWKNDPVYRNHCITAGKVNRMLKSQGSSKNGESSGNYFPWTSKELWIHLESLFEPWMHERNQGAYNPETHHLPEMRTWQLDHIIPKSDLPYGAMDHPNFYKCWNLSNLRPLDAKQNILDGVNRTRHKKTKT